MSQQKNKQNYQRNSRNQKEYYATDKKNEMSSWKKIGLVWLMGASMFAGSVTKLWADYKNKNEIPMNEISPNAIYYDNGCIVEEGDTIGKIAKENKMTLEEIAKYNPGLKPNRITEGQQIYLTPEKKDMVTYYSTENFNGDSDEVLLARMLFGEGKNCSEEEKMYIAMVALNRTRDNKSWNGNTLREVILKPQQFSCFNSNDNNYSYVKNPERHNLPEFKQCLEISKLMLESYPKILNGELKDPTDGATYYYTKEIKPYWKKDMKKFIEVPEFKHIFAIAKN